MPTIAIVLPGPQPRRTSGLYTVMPAQSMGAASSVGISSGILKVK